MNESDWKKKKDSGLKKKKDLDRKLNKKNLDKKQRPKLKGLDWPKKKLTQRKQLELKPND